jgi:hypothetical protein
MSNIPIVQGVAVPNEQSNYSYHQAQSQPQSNYNYQAQPQQSSGGGEYTATGEYASQNELRELRQNPVKQYQDVVWAFLFIAHLAVMVVVLSIGLTSHEGNVSSGSYGNIIFLVAVTGLSAVGLATAALSFMMNNAVTLVKASLIFSVLCSLAAGIAGFMFGSLMMGILGLLSFLVGIWYAKVVWPRIPYAAANLNTALTAVRQNMGLTAVAYLFLTLAFGWSVFWFLGLGDALAGTNLPVVFLLFVSFYWVHQVLTNTVHVTVAGVIGTLRILLIKTLHTCHYRSLFLYCCSFSGTWWFIPDEANSFWSKALTESFSRATTYSFGSICFGSLLVAIVQALRALEHYTRENDDMSALQCIIQCILGCIESIIEVRICSLQERKGLIISCLPLHTFYHLCST